MAVRIPDHIIADVRDKSDIVAVIGRYVQLRQRGSSYTGLCPFHSEKTPSFSVSPSRQSYYCFGCQIGGDVIDFIMRIEGKTFMETLDELAEAAGVELPKATQAPEDRAREREREESLKANRLAADFFRERFQGSEGVNARRYLEQRGLGQDVISRFELGYAPPAWDALTAHLARHKVPAALAVKLGLCGVRRSSRQTAEAESGIVTPTHHYDFFRDRVLFPIFGAGGGVLGFSGRLLDPEAKERKYVNSPESPVYRKSEILFGLPQARPGMRRSNRVILVEGNVDVLAMHQAGFPETVAPLGTALTERQIHMLRRYVGEVVLAYDGDAAGAKAARRAAQLLSADDVVAGVAVLPEGRDPGDFVLENPERMEQVLAAATSAPAFLIEASAKEAGETVEERVRAAGEIGAVLGRISNPVVRDEYVRQAATAFRLRPEQMRRLLSGQQVDPRQAEPRKPAEAISPERHYAMAALGLLAAYPWLAPVAEQVGLASFIEDATLRDLVRAAVHSQAETGRVDVSALLRLVPDVQRNEVAKALMADRFEKVGDQEIDASRAFAETVDRFRLSRLMRELTALDGAIKDAESRGEADRRKELIRRRYRLSQEKNDLVSCVARGEAARLTDM